MPTIGRLSWASFGVSAGHGHESPAFLRMIPVANPCKNTVQPDFKAEQVAPKGNQVGWESSRRFARACLNGVSLGGRSGGDSSPVEPNGMDRIE
ncbi:MAG: hypothetical protein LBV30_05685 [Propionibacteriaceae bacterium]|jgi:hypothetical protein|nr:hypothetical protein [Propionibacteriaceae bacterium]